MRSSSTPKRRPNNRPGVCATRPSTLVERAWRAGELVAGRSRTWEGNGSSLRRLSHSTEKRHRGRAPSTGQWSAWTHAVTTLSEAPFTVISDVRISAR